MLCGLLAVSFVAWTAQGLDRAKLDRARDELAARGTRTFIVMWNGEIAYEWYAPNQEPNQRLGTASLAKALVGGISLMVAVEDGLLDVDDPAWKYIRAWRNDPVRSKITIRHLVTHTSGIEDAEQDGLPHEKLPGWKGAFWRRDPDPFSIAIHQAPVRFEPGTKYAYSNPGFAALAYAVTASLKGTPHRNIRALLKHRVFEPIGLRDEEWSIGYDRPYDVDGLRLYATWGGGSFTARAVARIGQWMLQRGRWNDRPLVDSTILDRAVADAGMPKPARTPGNPNPASGLGWWTNEDGVWRNVPTDAFAGAGAGHRVLLVVPSLKLVVVRNGDWLNEEGGAEGFWGAIEQFVFNPVIGALGLEPPYRPSPVVAGVHWAPADQIVRRARGSDNWPVTWADDDALYTAYGDGWGFEPRLDAKLSLGLAKVHGPAQHFQGVNLRAASAERIGDGDAGEKASGILMVDGTLYLWVRNAGNSKLGWSLDDGRTWSWSDWTFTESLGHPAFLNFGKNYAGARDTYVYIYSPDRDSAYKPADRLVLARVPKDRIRERDAYEFLERVDAAGGPVWTRDIARRGAAFSFPGLVYRSQVTYHPALKRYLLCGIIPIGDTRFDGGFGLYDAPEPWGPWTTVFFTRKWDTGPGENCSFPTKWMSADGKTVWMVFSGDDHFSVRQATLEMRK
ncbi:MAG: serine hydrolase [Luteitalea sp.]|nr:serine hydrolase [Luteitalea sp.]